MRVAMLYISVYSWPTYYYNKAPLYLLPLKILEISSAALKLTYILSSYCSWVMQGITDLKQYILAESTR